MRKNANAQEQLSMFVDGLALDSLLRLHLIGKKSPEGSQRRVNDAITRRSWTPKVIGD